MPRIPDAITVAGPDTHCLVVAVPYDGVAEVSSSVPRPVAARILRNLADGLEQQPCPTSLATGQPCPVHDRPARAGVDALLDAVAAQLPAEAERCENCGHAPHGHAEHATDPSALTDCPHCPCAAELREMNGEEPAKPAEDWVDDVRSALAFNAPDAEAALATLRDVLLDTAPRTPAQALAAARVLLAAHARELAEQTRKLAQERGAEMRERGDRSRVATCAGMHAVRRHLADHADRLDEQADQ